MFIRPSLAEAARRESSVLINGDRITCEVKLLSRGRLQVKTDDAGTLQIEWTQVASVTATLPFDVGTDDATTGASKNDVGFSLALGWTF